MKKKCVHGSRAGRHGLRERVAAVISVVGYQFPRTPEGQLMGAVVAQALLDLLDERLAAEAAAFLRSDMPQADLAGVSPCWIRRMIQRAGIGLSERRAPVRPRAMVIRPRRGPVAAQAAWGTGFKVCPHPRCPHRGGPQPIDDFDRRTSRRDGRQTNCKDCRRRAQREADRRRRREAEIAA
jgi:hypothetical protein